MKVLMVLDYYRPYVSGLSITVERLALGLAKRGHRITVLAHQHEASLPREEQDGEVRILRAPVLARIGKGLLSPALVRIARREMRDADLLHLHAPLAPVVPLTLIARANRLPIVMNFHCDLKLPTGRLNRVIERIARASQEFALARAAVIINSTEDYARSMPCLARRMDRFVAIAPPVPDASVAPGDVERLKTRWGVTSGPVILFVGRFAAEKGIPQLIESFPSIRREFPGATLLLAGERHAIPGEKVGEQVAHLLLDKSSGVVATGLVPDEWMPGLFALADVLVLPSLNSTESFGMIQVEAMLCGLPVVASDLPGVREPVRMTGMGEIAPAGDSGALAAQISRVLRNPGAYRKPRAFVRDVFSLDRTFELYEDAYRRALANAS